MVWRKESRQARGYGRAWELVRKHVLQRDNYLCQSCARKGRVTSGNEVHHIKPKAQCGTDDDVNLETLCHACHEEADAQAQGKTLRQKVRFGLDGYPIEGAL